MTMIFSGGIRENKCWNICQDKFGSCKELGHIKVPAQGHIKVPDQGRRFTLDEPLVEITGSQETL